MKYHLNSSGDALPCRAKVRCPFGDLNEDHYDSKAQAREAYEHRNDPFNQPVERRVDTYAWPDSRETVHREFKATGVDGSVTLTIGASRDRGGRGDRPLEAWMVTPEGETVAFLKLTYHDETYNPTVGAHLGMCDIETRLAYRGQGWARALRASVEAETGLLTYSSGSYTPEGWAAFGDHGRYAPNPYASSWDAPGVKFRSMGFVASWSGRVPRYPDRDIDYTAEQRDAMWDLSERGVFRAMQDKEILWIED